MGEVLTTGAGAVYSAVPIAQVEFSRLQDDDDLSLDGLSDKGQSEPYNLDGFIFGLRMGFTSQFLIGFVVLFNCHDELSAAMDSLAGIACVTAVLCASTVAVAILSNKLHACMKQSPQLEQCQNNNVDRDFRLFHGTLLGMYMAWLLFDLILENGLVILGIHSAIAFVGYFYGRPSKEILLQKQGAVNSDLLRKRRIVDDDLLRSLDLA